MAKVISIGNQSFESIREKDNFYIDKTNFIREWWDNDDTVTLITRPRRFGKTLNMSMLNCFFSNKYADMFNVFPKRRGLVISVTSSSLSHHSFIKPVLST